MSTGISVTKSLFFLGVAAVVGIFGYAAKNGAQTPIRPLGQSATQLSSLISMNAPGVLDQCQIENAQVNQDKILFVGCGGFF